MSKRIKRTAVIVMMLLLTAVFVYFLCKVIAQLTEEKKVRESFERLSRVVRTVEEQLETTEPAAQVTEKTVLPQYSALHEENNDLFGWIRIEDTPIDYPVMYIQGDSDYYLRRDFYGDYLISGVPFIDGDCPEDGNFFLIYGHHMKNGTMFGTLPLYSEKEYWESHKTVRFDTLYEKRAYTVIAAFYGKIYDDDRTDVFKYYEYRDLSDKEVFEEYVAGVISSSLYDTDTDVKYGDELLTLSTCNYHTDNGRFVIVAKRVS